MSVNYDPVTADAHEEEALPPKTEEESRVPLKCWINLFISCAGVLMASISSTALVIVFPQLMEELNASISTVLYSLIMLMLMIACLVGIVGKLGDVFGQATLYKFGMLMFTVGSLIAGLSDKKYKGMDLLGARCVTGFGAAFLFTNSAAILTTAFAPYNKVGLAQGIYSISSAAGMVLGPVVGGGFGAIDWRWIFFWNVPLGGLCFLLSLWAVQEQRTMKQLTWLEFSQKFDFVGAFTYPIGLCLIFIAMMQLVAPEHPLCETTPLAVIIAVASVCGLIFLVDQFLAVDPLFPPHLFRKRVFAATNLAGTCMAFVRNSITYNFIFFFQGPRGMSPLQAGIGLIPFGAGVMLSGLVSGALSDNWRPAVLSVVGCLTTMVALIVMLTFDETTSYGVEEFILGLAGVGIGLFGSPNTMSLMISVDKNRRGMAAALNYLTLMFTSMLGIVLTFNFVLNSMSQQELFQLFIYGGQTLKGKVLHRYLQAIRKDFYIVIAVCGLGAICASFNNTPAKKDESRELDPLSPKSEEVQKRPASIGSEHKLADERTNLGATGQLELVPLDEDLV